MRQTILSAVILMMSLQGSANADDSMTEARKHLYQANGIFFNSSKDELEKWGQWFRNLARKDKQFAKKWLKEKIDHC